MKHRAIKKTKRSERRGSRCWLSPRTNVQRDEISRLRRRNKLYIYIYFGNCVHGLSRQWRRNDIAIALRKISRSSARINGVSSHEQYRDAKYFTRCSDISHPYVRYELYIESRNISCRANDYHRINCITTRDISFTVGRNYSRLKS